MTNILTMNKTNFIKHLKETNEDKVLYRIKQTDFTACFAFKVSKQTQYELCDFDCIENTNYAILVFDKQIGENNE